MASFTDNYGLEKQLLSDYINIEGINENFDIIDEEMFSKADKTDIPTSLPADGGDADTVNGHTVETNVPADAKFTDTIYDHPLTHPANMIEESTARRFVSDAEKLAWNGKSDKAVIKTATLTTAGWTGTSSPYTQTVNVTGATASNNILFDLGMNVTTAQFEAGMDAQLKATAQGSGTVTIKAFGDKPTINIPVQFVILG